MKTIIRITLSLLVTAITLVIIGSLAVLFLVDPNEYRDDLASLVEDQTGREFTIEGELSLNVFPCCSVAIGKTSLSNPPGFESSKFIQVESASVSLALLPLITERRLQVGELSLDGVDATLITLADGTTNWDFGDGSADEAEEPATDGQAADLEALNIAGLEK